MLQADRGQRTNRTGKEASSGFAGTSDAKARARLRERTETLGPDRLGDLVLDLSVDELAAWLADPNAR